MTLTEALKEVSSFYMPGVVKFYSEQKQDPWQSAYDELEKSYRPDDWFLNACAADRFLSKTRDLVDKFLEIHPEMQKLSVTDEFYLAHDEQRSDRLKSLRAHKCVKCNKTTDLKFRIISKKEAEVICQDCDLTT